MKLLILGANGMLGHALMRQFASDDIFVGDLPEFDLTKPEELREKIKQIEPEIIINAAAFTDVDGCETKKDLANAVNGQAVGDLAKICSELNIILVHYSTDYVFNGQKKDGYAESEKLEPLNAYGESKALGEKLLQANCQNYYLIRTAWLFGQDGKNFVQTIVNLSHGQDEIKVVNDQIGSPTYATDLALATRQILIDKKPYGIYHLTNSGQCSWYEFALKIKELRGFDANIKAVSTAEFPRLAKRPNYSILLNSKLSVLRSWQEALADYLKK